MENDEFDEVRVVGLCSRKNIPALHSKLMFSTVGLDSTRRFSVIKAYCAENSVLHLHFLAAFGFFIFHFSYKKLKVAKRRQENMESIFSTLTLSMP